MRKDILLLSLLFAFITGKSQSWDYVDSLGLSLNSSGGDLVVDRNTGTIYCYVDNQVKYLNGTNWMTLGNLGTIGSFSMLAINNVGEVYIAYTEVNSNKASVKKYSSGNWIQVGVTNFSDSLALYLSIIIDDNDVPYVAYRDYGWGSKLTVKKFNGTSWVTVGTNGFTTGIADYISIKLDNNNVPFVAYTDASFSYKVNVRKFNGTAWVSVGSPNFSYGTGFYTSLSIYNNIPYVIYSDGGDAFKTYCKMYNGTTWTNVGVPGFTGTPVDMTTLAFNSIGSPSIAFREQNGSASVMKYENNTWSYIGPQGFTNSGANGLNYVRLIFDNSDNPYIAFSNWNNNSRMRVMKFNGTTPYIQNVLAPYINISNGVLSSGQTLIVNGYNFTPNNSVTLMINGPNSFQQTLLSPTSSTGSCLANFTSNNTMPSGQYVIHAVDFATGIYAPIKSFVLSINQNITPQLTLLSPVTNETLLLNDANEITWTDKLILGQNYSVVGAKRNYKYTIEVSTDNGNTWPYQTTTQGLDYINTIKTFHVPVVFSSTGNSYVVRVTDFYNAANTDASGTFNVIDQVTFSNNIQVDFYWDHSYNNQNNALYGIAADGTARIYLALSKINSNVGPPISNVSVQISDQDNTTTATLGKVMAATQISSYDNEANSANSLSATQNTEALSHFWFWYVAPDDFKGNNPNDYLAAYRYVKAHFTITYSDNSTETIDKNIKIVRPPLCFVHGLGSDPSAWSNFRHTAFGYEKEFLNDSRFYTKRAIQINPTASFNMNAQSLIIGWPNNNSLMFQNSFPGVIEDLRNQGYAANRCDYIAHSMGGSVLRYALDNYSDYFNRIGVASNRDYKNYERGYLNKVITINTPHNSSPWADILNRYTPDLTYAERMAIQLDYGQFPNSLPFSFITQDNYGLLGVPTFKVNDAVRDLQIDQNQGGVNFGYSNVKAHLIGSDFFPGIQTNTNNLIPQTVINTVDQYADDVDFLNQFLELTIAEEQDQQVVSDLVEISDQYDNPVQTALQYIERMADLYNTALFIPESDLVVGVSSQLADYPRTAPNVTVFDNYIGHAFIRPVLGDVDAGDKVNELLNANISSNEFAGINATSNMAAPHFNNSRSITTLVSVRDTAKFQILNPLTHTNLVTDSMVDIKISLPDTAHLISVKVKFQNKTYKLSKTPGIIDLKTQVNSNLLDSNYIFAEAFYKYPDTSWFFYDTVIVNVTTTSNLIGFSAKQDVIYLYVNQTKIPDYVSYYQGFATSVSTFSHFITASVDNNTILSFDPVLKGFKGLATGETYSVVSYKGISDTIYFVVGENPLDSLSTGLQEIYSASLENRDLKLLCYPNPVNQQMKIDFEVAITGEVTLKVFDVMGNEMLNIFEGKREKGIYQTGFDGSKLSNGIYFCELRNGSMRTTKRIVVVR